MAAALSSACDVWANMEWLRIDVHEVLWASKGAPMAARLGPWAWSEVCPMAVGGKNPKFEISPNLHGTRRIVPVGGRELGATGSSSNMALELRGRWQTVHSAVVVKYFAPLCFCCQPWPHRPPRNY